MRAKRLRMALMLLIPGAALAAMLWFALGSAPAEPAYQGRKLSYWLELLYAKYPPAPGHSQVSDSKTAYAAVKKLGTNAIPTLLFLLQTTNAQTKLEFHKPSHSLDFLRIHKASAEDLNAEAARGFQCLGADAQGAVPAIIKIYEGRLSESSERWSSYALGAMGPCASSAVPALLRGATNASPQSRKNSLIALAGMHAEPELTVAALTNAFTDPDPDVRKWACNRFGLLGREAWKARARALPALEPLLRDPDQSVRQEAGFVFPNIQSQR
jgi:HEAT repeat protein